eukprot:TRINITY_DN4920_c0_g2_i3.p2 TRINITY_DN4920_c0_g2~~TRINITY_DN4920_c0_g2_i3.p2  ORF type:complete len:141 (-),score=28.73 TRINITY_DN4920_c0_g2_i3:964-1386(-)
MEENDFYLLCFVLLVSAFVECILLVFIKLPYGRFSKYLQQNSAINQMTELVGNPEGFKSYRNFLLKSYAEESLDFFAEVEKLHVIPEGQVPFQARKIFSTYISFDASIPINVSAVQSARAKELALVRSNFFWAKVGHSAE